MAENDALQQVPYEGEAESNDTQTSSAAKGTGPPDPSVITTAVEEVVSDDRKPAPKQKTAPEAVVTTKRKRSATETSDTDVLSAHEAADVSSYAEVAGVYAPLLRLRNKRERDEIPVVPLPPRTIGGLRDQIEKQKQCNCKRSHCLKLYCECFASGIHCSAICNCVSCKNNEMSGSNDRNESILLTLERNQHAFRPRIIAIAGAAASVSGVAAVHGDATTVSSTTPLLNDVLTSPGGAHSFMGCNCKKSFCLKKYCECFHAAVYCNPPHCRCIDCQNTEGNPERERLVAKRRTQAEAAAAAAALAHQHSRLAHMSGRMAMMGDVGRTYYGTEHLSTNGGEKLGDMEHTEAAAMVAGAAAGGVDVSLPPSSYAVPMQLKNGTSYAALSFGRAGPRSMGQSAADVPTSPQPSTPMKQTPSRAKKAAQRKRPRTQIFFPLKQPETELEKAWKMEVEKAKMTFSAIRQQLQQGAAATTASTTSDSTGLLPSPLPAMSENSIFLTPDKKLDKGKQDANKEKELSIQARASAIVGSVKGDLQRLVEAWLTAEPWAVQMSNGVQNISNGVAASNTVPAQKNNDPMNATVGEQQENESKLMDGKEKKPSAGGSNAPEAMQLDTSVDDGDSQKVADEQNSNSKNKTNGAQPVGVTDGQTGSELDLVCTEEMDPEGDRLPLSDAAIRELTILAAQDAALLRELAQNVRNRALKMTKARIRYATDTSSDK